MGASEVEDAAAGREGIVLRPAGSWATLVQRCQPQPTSRKDGEKWGTRLFLAPFTSGCVATPITYFVSFEMGDLIDAF